MKNVNKQTISILGGMGPGASVYIYRTLIQLSIRYFGAKDNEDFPNITVHSLPVPDFITTDKNKVKAFRMLREKVLQADEGNTLCLAIACNTAHILLPLLQEFTKVPFISMVEEVSEVILKTNIKTVGLISTPSTLRYGLYNNALNKKGVKIIKPNPKQTLDIEKIIRNIVAGKRLSRDTKKLATIATSMRKKGAQGIILGCTETPLVFPKKIQIPVFNSVEILSMALLRKYYK